MSHWPERKSKKKPKKTRKSVWRALRAIMVASYKIVQSIIYTVKFAIQKGDGDIV